MKVSIIGSGTMGSSIAALLCSTPSISAINVVVRSENAASALEVFCEKYIKRVQRNEKLRFDNLHECMSRLTISQEKETLVGSCLVIEAVSEDYVSKAAVLTELSKVVSGDTIIATNTSSLSISKLAENLNYPEMFLGLHFFNPATTMGLVEIVTIPLTHKSTLTSMQQFAQSLGKKSVVVSESPGFIVNRMLIPMINEAISIYEEGLASVADIDAAMKTGANHPMGPLKLADFIGTDVVLSILDSMYSQTSNPKHKAAPLLRDMVGSGFLGKKAKKGFYDY